MRKPRARETPEEVLRSRELLEDVLDYAPGFILALDERGRLEFINRVLPQHDMGSVIGSDWLQYMPPAQRESLDASFHTLLDTGVAQTYETKVAGPDGKNIWLTTHMGPRRSAGRIVGAVLVSQEITELRRAQLEFAAAQRMAAVGTLAAGIAHEINTPVQFVGDSLGSLREGLEDVLSLVGSLQTACRLAADASPSPALREALATASEREASIDLPYLRAALPEALDRCTEGLQRVASIVRSVREFAHPASLAMAPVDLNRAIINTLNMARSEYAYVADLETRLDELPPVTCHVDQINQAVLNLVVNAAHAIGDVVKVTGIKGHLTVRTAVEGEAVVIAVEDSGTGIADSVHEHVFEPFFTTKEVGKGTGQGLALAFRHITQNHGGTLSFETLLGKGTTFFVKIPIAGKARANTP